MTSSDFKFEYITVKVDQDDIMVRTVIVDGNRWYNAKKIATLLGYKNTDQSIREHVSVNDKKTLADLISKSSDDYNENTSKYINGKGLKQLIHKTRMPNSIEVAKHFGIPIETKYTQQETEIVGSIQKFLTCLQIPFAFQRTVDHYRVDLYLPNHKIAIEIDEKGHKYRCPKYEQDREAYVQKKLSCTFLRINPDAHNFNMITSIAEITKLLYNA